MISLMYYIIHENIIFLCIISNHISVTNEFAPKEFDCTSFKPLISVFI